MITKADAVLALKPGATWTMRDDVLEWHDDKITKPTDAEIKKKYDELVANESLNNLRQVRNMKMRDSDWVVIKEREEGGSVSNFADWKKYRQELRDITNTYKSLEDVKWPTAPTE